MHSNFMKLAKYLIFITPLTLGMIGLSAIEKVPTLDAFYHSISMYLFDYSDHPANIWIEIARWSAPAMTASGIILGFLTLKEYFIHSILNLTKQSVAVYGPIEDAEPVIKECKYAFLGKNKYIPASKYILLNDEISNFNFYIANIEKLKDKDVYLKSSSLPSQSESTDHLHLFCSEEISARLFWKKNFLYPLACSKQHKLEIVLIGFEFLGEQVLLHALQNNIFSPTQKITYRIFADESRFQSTHTELAHISDQIIFCKDSWYEHLHEIENADMVIVLNQNNQIQLLQDLLFSTTRQEIHVFADNAKLIDFIDGNHRLTVFNWKKESHNPNCIFKDDLYKRAKTINLRYAHLYSGVTETKEEMENQWKKLDPFTRYSNISSADYHEMRINMIRHDQISADHLLTDQLELFSHLEHIRWSRYHILNNWKYGIPSDGKAKDPVLRIHRSLTPYQELSEEEKEKDRENIRILHSLD